jgi:hypothetical protein
MEAVDTVVRPVKDFAKDSIRLVKRCHKPDRRGTCASCRFMSCHVISVRCEVCEVNSVREMPRVVVYLVAGLQIEALAGLGLGFQFVVLSVGLCELGCAVLRWI